MQLLIPEDYSAQWHKRKAASSKLSKLSMTVWMAGCIAGCKPSQQLNASQPNSQPKCNCRGPLTTATYCTHVYTVTRNLDTWKDWKYKQFSKLLLHVTKHTFQTINTVFLHSFLPSFFFLCCRALTENIMYQASIAYILSITRYTVTQLAHWQGHIYNKITRYSYILKNIPESMSFFVRSTLPCY